MIERVYVKNFRRIGECDMTLRDGLTVLIGKNGTGKSSIIEAITFNLYGKIKEKTNKESVRRKNAPEGDPTITVVDFEMNGTYYRCRRWYTAKMSTMATLYAFTAEEYEELSGRPATDFDKNFGEQVADGTTGVSAAIANLLGVSFDGFKASFVAQQKELNSFAGLQPEKRKEFFLNLLGYAALDSVKPELSSRVKALTATIRSLETQNLNVDEIQRRILANEKEITKYSQSIDKGTKMLSDVDEKRKAAAQEYEDVRVISEKVRTYQSDVAKLSGEKTSLIQDCASLDSRITANEQATKDFDASTSIADQLHAVQTKASRNKELTELRNKKEQIEIQVKDLEAEVEKDAKTIRELEAKTKEEPDTGTPKNLVMELQGKYSGLANERKNLQASIDRLSGLIASVDRGEMAKCPTCGNSIADEEGKAHLGRELADVQAQHAKVEQDIAVCTEQGKAAKEKLEIAEMAARTYNDDKRALASLASKQKANLDDLQKRRATFAEYVQKEQDMSDAVMTSKEVFLLNEEIAKLLEQKANEDKMRSLVSQLAQDKQARQFKQERIAAIDTELADREAYLKENKRKADSLERKLAKKAELEEKTTSYRNRLNELTEKRASCKGALDADQGNLKKAIQQSEQLADLKEQVEDAICAQQVVETLRKELPARIAPRLSDVAGHLLDIATNGRYSIIELDEQYNVNVYTDDDIRTINQMSGGEADVISLSLRIAIAKILLEASGMPTQTFILDEIFGALDDERRESTCTALMNIQNELSKILCITHIDEIKDMADYTYVVEMDENGVSWVREQVNAPAAMMNAVAEAAAAETEVAGATDKEDD